jgi:hypothetical protein
LAVFDQIDRTTDGRPFFPAHSGPGAVAHVDHLSGMYDLDPTVVATELPQLRFDLSGVANKKEFPDMGILTQSEHGSANQIRWAKVAPHRIQRDFHESQKFAFTAPLMQNQSSLKG